VVPDRGKPTTKIGAVELVPPAHRANQDRSCVAAIRAIVSTSLPTS
jgi:hypothetical protein